MKTNKVGRKKGFRMTEEGKKKISESKLGVARTQETKDKIGKGMKVMWKDLKMRANAFDTKNRSLAEVIEELKKN